MASASLGQHEIPGIRERYLESIIIHDAIAVGPRNPNRSLEAAHPNPIVPVAYQTAL